MNPKVVSLLGLARRAGKVYSGESQVEAMLKRKKGYLVIIAEDSPGANAKFGQWAKELNIQVLLGGDKEELGLAIGLSPRAVILIADQGFADAIYKAWDHLG
ncbi:MAG: L7Ae/L30e/S12e/Gadd45 family protein [Peptococcaceae bacterium]|jgi:ribosomal protein L7Ae-like RNA K-turn-binding protein|nr:L7Ae/L30e/S12e/Gadd45 family protein [Peptococcaceae bacterium]